MFSDRTKWPTQPNPLSELLSRLKQEGKSILDLTESNPTRAGFNYLAEELNQPLLTPNNLSYEPDPKGLLNAREVIRDYYREKGVEIETNQIFLFSSTSEAYLNLFKLLTNPDDRILVPSISYPLFDYLGGLCDLTLDQYSLNYEKGWKIDLGNPNEAPPAKVLLAVNPNNPTGNYVTNQERGKLNEFARAKHLSLIVDEVFYDFALDEDCQRTSFASNKDVLTFTLSGISKVLGLPQMKLSWVVINGPKHLVEEATRKLEVITDTFLSPSVPIQNALAGWFQKKEIIQSEIQKRIQKNFDALKKQAGESLEILSAQGGWYAILKVDSELNDEALALSLLEKDLVYLHPGYFFDFEEENYLVVSLLTQSTQFRKGIEKLVERCSPVSVT